MSALTTSGRHAPGRERVLAELVGAAVAVGSLAALDPTTLRPGPWTLLFYALLAAGALAALVLVVLGRHLSDGALGVLISCLMTLVVVSVLANQSHAGGAFNVVLLLPCAVFAAVHLPRAVCRAVTVVLVVCIGVIMRAVTGELVQWLTLVALPLLSFVGTTEVVLRLRSQLGAAADALMQQSLIDPLTGLLNRRSLHDRLAGDAGSGTGIATVLVLDIDHFKAVNDTLGHAAGDEVLRRFGAGLAAETREGDVVVRLGGEEFLVLSTTRADRAEQFADNLRRRAAAWMQEWSVTVSVGVLTVLDPGPTGLHGPELDAALQMADSCLYAAKESGRDRVVTTVLPTLPRIARDAENPVRP